MKSLNSFLFTMLRICIKKKKKTPYIETFMCVVYIYLDFLLLLESFKGTYTIIKQNDKFISTKT